MQWKTIKLYKNEEDLQEVISRSEFQDIWLSGEKRCERVYVLIFAENHRKQKPKLMKIITVEYC